jgi:hypothetical protein
VLAAASTDEFSVPVLVAAGAVALLWWLVVAIVVAVRRPPSIRGDGSGALDQPPEPPAVAGILAGDFEVADETAPAVLLDLAARGFVDLEEVQPGRTICRLRAGAAERGGPPLAGYEARVLAELRTKAIDGIVPADALTTGPDAQSKGWHRALVHEVVDDAQARGLTRARWPKALVTALSFGLAAVVVLLAVSSQVGGDADDDATVIGAIAAAIAIAGVAGGAVVVARLGRSLTQLPTDAGRTAATRVVNLATTLRTNESFETLPPAGVTLWDRLFAYAAAFGAAPLAVALLPMGAEDDHRAWSRFGGRWRTVRVRYPRSWPPAWGKHPVIAIALSLTWGTVALLVGYGLLQLANAERPVEIEPSTWDWVELGTVVALVPVLILLAWCAWVLVRAVPDLWQTGTVTGDVVRGRRFKQVFSSGDEPQYWNYLAVDDGSRDRIAAWRVRDVVWHERRQGESVIAEVTPRLGYVRSMTAVAPPPPMPTQ